MFFFLLYLGSFAYKSDPVRWSLVLSNIEPNRRKSSWFTGAISWSVVGEKSLGAWIGDPGISALLIFFFIAGNILLSVILFSGCSLFLKKWPGFLKCSQVIFVLLATFWIFHVFRKVCLKEIRCEGLVY